MTDYGGTEREIELRAKRIAQNRADAIERKRRKLEGRLPRSEVDKKIDARPDLAYLCGVHRIVWRSDPTIVGERAYIAREPCDGARGADFHCCFLCSQWMDLNQQKLRDWFGLAITLDKRAASYLKKPGHLMAIWSDYDLQYVPQ